jgi:uncharacterized protein (TIGR02246 family)
MMRLIHPGAAMSKRLLRYLSLVLPVLGAPAHAAGDAGLGSTLDAAYGVWSQGMQSGDMAQIMSLYTEDAVWCGVDGACFTGHAAIEAMNRDRIQRNGAMRSVEPKTTSLSREGDYVYEWGHTRVVSAKGEQRSVHYLAVWRRQPDGGWKISRDILLPD